MTTLQTAAGMVVNPDTGEVVEGADAGALTDTLGTYANARRALDAWRLRLADAEAAAAGDLDEQLADLARTRQERLATDATVARHRAHLAEAAATVEAIEATLGAMFTDRTGAVSFDTPTVRVTWGKARETWSLDKPIKDLASRAAWRELVDIIGRDMIASDLADAIIRWLGPKSKVGELPAPRITLRDGGA